MIKNQILPIKVFAWSQNLCNTYSFSSYSVLLQSCLKQKYVSIETIEAYIAYLRKEVENWMVSELFVLKYNPTFQSQWSQQKFETFAKCQKQQYEKCTTYISVRSFCFSSSYVGQDP